MDPQGISSLESLNVLFVGISDVSNYFGAGVGDDANFCGGMADVTNLCGGAALTSLIFVVVQVTF